MVGGEVALAKGLSAHIKNIISVGISDKIELVTNGLYPQGITSQVLKLLDSVVISDYICSDKFEYLWRQYLSFFEFEGDITFRRKEAWDDLFSEVGNLREETIMHWKKCFYRNYDVTLERGRLFSCSRIAKKNLDHQGLSIDSNTSLEDIKNYLLSYQPKEACYSCATVGNFSRLPVAEQMNSNLDKIASKAELFMQKVVTNG